MDLFICVPWLLAASVEVRHTNRWGHCRFWKGARRCLSHRTRHTRSQVCTVSIEMRIKKGAEEEAYLFFVYSKEGLHWGIGAASKQIQKKKKKLDGPVGPRDAFPPTQA